MDLLNVGLKSIDVHNTIPGDGRAFVQSDLLHRRRRRARLNEEGQKGEKSCNRETHDREKSE